MYLCILLSGLIFWLLHLDVREIIAYSFTPKNCSKITQMVIEECCPFRPLFAGQAMKTCGIEWNETDLLESPEDCNYYACVFDEMGWMHLNGTVDYGAYKKSLDDWTKYQYNIKGSMQLAQNKCFKWPWRTIEYPREPFRKGDNLTICQIKRVNACLQVYTLWYCRIKRSHFCDEYRQIFVECRPYLFEP